MPPWDGPYQWYTNVSEREQDMLHVAYVVSVIWSFNKEKAYISQITTKLDGNKEILGYINCEVADPKVSGYDPSALQSTLDAARYLDTRYSTIATRLCQDTTNKIPCLSTFPGDLSTSWKM